VFEALGLDTSRVIVIVRPPPDVSLFTASRTRCFPGALLHRSVPEVQAMVLPRTEAQRDYVKGLELPSVVVAEHAVDAQSLSRWQTWSSLREGR